MNHTCSSLYICTSGARMYLRFRASPLGVRSWLVHFPFSLHCFGALEGFVDLRIMRQVQACANSLLGPKAYGCGCNRVSGEQHESHLLVASFGHAARL